NLFEYPLLPFSLRKTDDERVSRAFPSSLLSDQPALNNSQRSLRNAVPTHDLTPLLTIHRGAVATNSLAPLWHLPDVQALTSLLAPFIISTYKVFIDI